jgi:enhancing lycopene biosynthesis protein 2
MAVVVADLFSSHTFRVGLHLWSQVKCYAPDKAQMHVVNHMTVRLMGMTGCREEV